MDTEFSRQGRLGVIRLNRPQVLNALAPGQFSAIHRQLIQWAKDGKVQVIVLEGAGERAFCAGGDIRAVWENRLRGEHALNHQLFCDEYRLDRLIHHYPKPIVSLLDGIVMGGGAGISINGRYRVATERSIFAMPEAAIGFFPDVGATHFLSRCPGKIGLYLGLTGARLCAADMVWSGLATHYIPSAKLEALKNVLSECTFVENALALAHRDPGPAPLAAEADLIERCCAHGEVHSVVAALAEAREGWAAALAAASPTALAVIFQQLNEGRALNFDRAIRREYNLARRFLAAHDFYEGIRAAVVDKDKAPQWRPESLALVSAAAVVEYFAPLGEELAFV